MFVHHLSKGARVIFQQNRAPDSVPIFLARPECCGFEESLTECNHRFPIGIHDCTHSSDLNVLCSTEGTVHVCNSVLLYMYGT